MKTAMLVVVGVLLMLSGCQRYQTFLLYESSESLDESRNQSEPELANEINSATTLEIRQHVLVDRKTGRVYYFGRSGKWDLKSVDCGKTKSSSCGD